MLAGTTWQVIVNLAQANGATIDAVKPVEGATGWSDTWMISSQAKPTRTACTCGWTGSSRRRPTPRSPSGSVRRRRNARAATSPPMEHCDDLPRRRDRLLDDVWYWTTATEECLDGRTDVDVRAVHRVGERLERAPQLTRPDARRRADAAGESTAARRRVVARPRASAGGFGRRHARPARSRRCSRRRSPGCSSSTSARSSLLVVTRLLRARPAVAKSRRRDLTLDNLRTAFTTSTVHRPSSCAASAWQLAVTVLCLADRAADGVLHRQGRQAVGPAGSHRGGAAAAVGGLPRQGVRVEGDAAARRREFGVDRRRRIPRSRRSGGRPGFGWTAVVITLDLPMAALHGAADLRRTRSASGIAARRLGDLGGRPLRTFRSVVDARARAGDRRRLDLHVLALAGRLHHAEHRHGGKTQLIGNLIARTLLAPNQPLAAAFTLWPIMIIVVYLLSMSKLQRLRETCEPVSR